MKSQSKVWFFDSNETRDTWWSEDLKNWTKVPLPEPPPGDPPELRPWEYGSIDYIFNNTLFLHNTATTWYSSDGINWTDHTNSPHRNLRSVIGIYNNKVWAVFTENMDYDIYKLYNSSDGLNWNFVSELSLPESFYFPMSVIYKNEMHLIDTELKFTLSSSDGAVWKQTEDYTIPGNLFNPFLGCPKILNVNDSIWTFTSEKNLMVYPYDSIPEDAVMTVTQ